MTLFIAVDKTTGNVLTHGQSIYSREASAKRGIGQFIRKELRANYVVVEIPPETIQTLLASVGG